MSKHIILFLLFLFSTQILHTQEIGFEYKSAQYQGQSSNFCIQNSEQHYVLAATIFLSEDSPLQTKIIELDENGELINEVEYEIENSTFFISNLIERSDFYIALGGVKRLENDSNFLWFAHIDFDLNIIKEKLIYLNNSLPSGNVCSIISDTIYGISTNFLADPTSIGYKFI